MVIDGSSNIDPPRRTEELFRDVGNHDWDQVGNTDEYVSRDGVPGEFARGSFLNRRPYTRLITYDSLEDLRADNQKFGPMPEEPEPGDPE